MQLIKDLIRVTLDTATLVGHVAARHSGNILESGALKIALCDQYAVCCIGKIY